MYFAYPVRLSAENTTRASLSDPVIVTPRVIATQNTTGPPPMMTAMKKNLDALGYEKPRTVSKKDDQVFMF